MIDDGVRTLAAAILKQAVDDINPSKIDRCSIAKIAADTQVFFKTEWFEVLAEAVHIDPNVIRRKIA
jgi:predicted ATP-dependent Lon-type protease